MKTNFMKLAYMLAIAGVITGCSSDDSKSDDPGTTNCPQGYTGFECSQQITPSKVFITKVVVVDFPYLDSDGFGWDSFTSNENEADIYIGIRNSNGQPIDVGNSYYQNADKLHEYIFIFPEAIELSNAYEILSIDLYDYDGNDSPVSDDDPMGTTFFSAYSDTSGFPSEKTVVNGKFKYRFSLQYQW